MNAALELALPALSCFLAFAAGAFGALSVRSGRLRAARQSMRLQLDAQGALEDAEGLEKPVLQLAYRQSRGGRPSARGGSARSAFRSVDALDELIRHAGLAGQVTDQGVQAARFRLALAGALAGAAAGVAVSAELGLALCVVGAFLGLSGPTWALRRMKQRRALELERALPEMLEVVALGLRSGLSFDRSFQLYSASFASTFARACESAQRSWSLGLLTRDEALYNLAQSYSSDQLRRTVERIIRSLRFGISLAPDLEAAASEARARKRAQAEERVAKAPVKMMVPTGALILPAMLLLVLGPVLLELMQG